MHLLLYFLFRANNNYKKTVGDYKLRGERGTVRAAKKVDGTRQWREDSSLFSDGHRDQGLTLGSWSVETKSYTTHFCKHCLFGFVPRKKLKRKKRSLRPQKTFPSPGWWRRSSKLSTSSSWNHSCWRWCMTSSRFWILSCWSESPDPGLSL